MRSPDQSRDAAPAGERQDGRPGGDGTVPSGEAPDDGVVAGTGAAGPADAQDSEDSRKGEVSTRRKVLEWMGALLVAAVVALFARTFVVQAFYIPSESMTDTLEVNDRVIVNKLTYRFGDIERGDIVVFDCPERYGCQVDDFIKRVIGLPGETVLFSGGEVYVDDMVLHEPYVDGLPTWSSGVPSRMEGCVEAVVTDRCTVRDGWVYVLGDNRMASRDSRWFGPVRQDTVAGRAAFKAWPLSDLGPL